jgi:ROS/MUCR transcriptional regulator protein
MRFGQRDGHGRYGILDDTAEGLLCHECGQRWRHLGVHVVRGHGITPEAYRERHGLQRLVGLVTAAVRTQMSVRASSLLDSPQGVPFLAARNTARAAQARRASGPAAVRAASRHAISLARHRRPRTVVVIVCARCGAEFCPLQHRRQRRFCSRSCAARHTRSAG